MQTSQFKSNRSFRSVFFSLWAKRLLGNFLVCFGHPKLEIISLGCSYRVNHMLQREATHRQQQYPNPLMLIVAPPPSQFLAPRSDPNIILAEIRRQLFHHRGAGRKNVIEFQGVLPDSMPTLRYPIAALSWHTKRERERERVSPQWLWVSASHTEAPSMLVAYDLP